MHVVNSWWVPFEFWWVYDAGRGDFGISELLVVLLLHLKYAAFNLGFLEKIVVL